MRATRAVWVALAVAAVAALVVSTGGFGAGTVERPVDISVADDHHAPVSIWDPGARGDAANPLDYRRTPPVRGRDTVTVLVVADRLDAPLTLRVRNRTGSPVAVTGGPTRVPAGSAVRLDARVDCRGRDGTTRVPLTLTADGDVGVSARVRTNATVACADDANRTTASRSRPSPRDRDGESAT